MKKLLYIAVLALAVVSCKKEPLPDLPDETGPYYSIKGYIDGEYINLNVGQEGIMISQGMEVKNGIETYYGQIVSSSEDLLIRVEVKRPETPLSPNGLNALQEGTLPYLVHEPGCLKPSFGSNILQSNYLLIKDASGVFIPTTEIEFEEYGIHDVTMKFTDVSQNSFQVPVNYGYKPMILDPKFTVFPLGDSINIVSIIPTGSHEWYVNNSLVSTHSEFHYQLPIGIHKIQHKIRDDNNNEATYTTLVRIIDYVFDWQMAIDGCQGPLNESNYGKVTVSVTKDGTEYTSNTSSQNLQNSFNVSDVEYVGNSIGVPSRAVFDIAFDAVVYNESGTEFLSLSNMTGTFNVGLQ